MEIEHSFGIVPCRKKDGGWELFLIQHLAGHWAFPKGKAEAGEKPLQTATRELFEETGLMIESILDPNPISEEYQFERQGELIQKSVQYYLALVKGELLLQPSEIASGKWLIPIDAEKIATFSQMKALCKRVEQDLKNKS